MWYRLKSILVIGVFCCDLLCNSSERVVIMVDLIEFIGSVKINWCIKLK